MRRPRQSPSPSPSSVLAVSSSALLFVLLFVAGAARCADDEGRNLDAEVGESEGRLCSISGTASGPEVKIKNLHRSLIIDRADFL